MEHHAYIYEGSQDLHGSLVNSAREHFNFLKDNDPDVHLVFSEKFGIEDAHALTRMAQLKSVSGRALFILGLAAINSQAQQALLKLFEEPQPGIIFVLLLPHGILLPTLRSRLMQYPQNLLVDREKGLVESKTTRGAFERQAADFLKSSYKVRSAQIAALLKDEENTKERVRTFLQSIENTLHVKLQTSKGDQATRMALEDISKVRSYLSDQSPSLKMLLEHLAATLPIL